MDQVEVEPTLKMAVIPEDAVHTLKAHLIGTEWFKGATLIGIGHNAVIEVATTSLNEAEGFISKVGGKWNGYRLRARRSEG